MKIQPSLRPTTETAEPRANAPAAKAEGAATAARGGAASAQVALSAASSALQSGQGDVDLAKVEALREAIRSGQLVVDTGRIADGLIESTRELLKNP